MTTLFSTRNVHQAIVENGRDCFRHKNLIFNIDQFGFLYGILVEKKRWTTSIWEVSFPTYHGGDIMHLNYSNLIPHKDNQEPLNEFLIQSFMSLSLVTDEDFRNFSVNSEKLSSEEQFQIDLFFQINHNMEKEISELSNKYLIQNSSNKFPWWKDTLDMLELAQSDFEAARQELDQRKKDWKKRLSVL